MSTDYYEAAAPQAPFPYTMQTTRIMEHSHGIAWTADLFREGTPGRLGVVEQMGDGGADRVTIFGTDERAMWRADVKAAFADEWSPEEAATLWLMVMEG